MYLYVVTKYREIKSMYELAFYLFVCFFLAYLVNKEPSKWNISNVIVIVDRSMNR